MPTFQPIRKRAFITTNLTDWNVGVVFNFNSQSKVFLYFNEAHVSGVIILSTNITKMWIYRVACGLH